MTNPRPLHDDYEDRPESPEMKREQELYEQYYRKFKEHPPSFGQPAESNQAWLAQIERAIKTGQPIVLNIPPDCEA